MRSRLPRTDLVRQDYVPRGQVASALADTGREVLLVGAAGSGKSRAWLEHLHRTALAHPRSRQLIVRHKRNAITGSAMAMMRDFVIPEGMLGGADSGKPVRWHSEEQAYLYDNGALIGVAGMDDPGKIYSTEWDRVYCQEVNQISARAYQSLLRAIRHNVLPHQQIVSDMNPQVNAHWMHQRSDSGVTREYIATHRDNPSNTPAYLAGLAALTGEEYQSLYLGRRVTIMSGAYYGEQLEQLRTAGRVREVPHDPALAVEASFDLGIADYMAIWLFQRVGRERHYLWYHEDHGHGLAHYSRLLRELGRDRRYDWGTLWFPHDGAARELGTELTRQESMKALRWDVQIVPVQALTDQHNAVRLALGTAYFDKAGCDLGLQRLGSYRMAQDEATGLWLPRPVHDEASHGASSFATSVLAKPFASNAQKKPVTNRPAWA